MPIGIKNPRGDRSLTWGMPLVHHQSLDAKKSTYMMR